MKKKKPVYKAFMGIDFKNLTGEASQNGMGNIAGIAMGGISDIGNIAGAFQKKASVRTGVRPSDINKEKGSAIAGGVATVGAGVLSAWGIPPSLSKPVLDLVFKPIGKLVGALSTDKSKRDTYNRQEDALASSEAAAESRKATAQVQKHTNTQSFAEGGKITDPKTDPKEDEKGKGTKKRRIRVIGSAPLIEESQLGFHIDKYKSLLKGDQEKTLREIAGRKEFGVEGSGTNVEFADKMRDFGIDPTKVRDQTFINEFNRTRKGFESNFSEVNFRPVHGADELEKALADFGDDEDVALLDHFSGTRILGNKVGNEKDINVPLKTSELSHTLKRSIKEGTNCYLGICHGEDVANQLKDQGVNLNFFARPGADSYTGPRMENRDKGFDKFFFGTNTKGAVDNPELGKDYLNIKNRKEVLAKRATKLEPLAPKPKKLVPTFRKGGALAAGKAVVLGGDLHENGGNKVKDTKGEIVAETEREELLLDANHTKALEKHIKLFNESEDEVHYMHLGEIMKDLIDDAVDESGKYS